MRTYHQVAEPLQMTELAVLAKERPGISVSIYVPTNERRGHEIAQEPLLLRRLVEDVDRQLVAKGWRNGEIAAFLAPLYDLAAPDQTFWPYQQRALAIFLAQDFYALYQLPHPCPPQARVGTHFWLRPLLSAIGADGTFYVLALSQKKVQLYRGTGVQLTEIAVPQLPTALAETLRFDQFERSLQLHSASSSGGATAGRRAAVFHGQGSAGDERIKHQQVDRFLQEVAQAVNRQLATAHAPLFLAGVDQIQNLYRHHNRYQHLVSANLQGNIDHLSLVELHRACLRLFHAHQEEMTAAALERYQELVPALYTVTGIEAVLQAAERGRVETLFFAPIEMASDALAAAQEHWGIIEPVTGHVTYHDPPEDADEELIDCALLHTLRNGGTIYPVAAEQMPAETLSAILRY